MCLRSRPLSFAAMLALAVCAQGAFSTGAQSAPQANASVTALNRLVASQAAWSKQQGGEGDDHLPHVDPQTQEKKADHWRNVVAQLGKIDRARLDEHRRLDYDVLNYQAQVAINNATYRMYQQPVNSDTSFWSELTDGARDPFSTAKEYRNYIARLQDIPRFFNEEIANMKAGAARGFTPPKVTLEGRDTAIKVVTEAGSIDESPLFAPFRTMPDSIPAAERETLRAQARKALKDDVLPAYRRLLTYFDTDYVPHTREDLAAEKMPDGKGFYQAEIYEFTTTTLTPEKIHQIGLEEGRKIHEEMLKTMHDAGFKGSFPEFLAFLRSDKQFYAKTPQELLNHAAWIAKEFDGIASRYIGFLPRGRFAIRPVPADEAPFYTSGRGGPGIYLVNTYALSSRPLYALPALTMHESAPGHALQMALVEEDKSLAPFRKEFISAYGEGWALYCERLGDEMGIYHTPYDRFGMLSYQAWRAARLVVDTGIHAMGWSREQAQKYLRDNTALPEHEIETEVDRYIAWPAQALSYYLGEATIWRLRHKAEKALGPKFNIRAFHDAVLATGSVPLPSLEEAVDVFIQNGGKGPHPEME